MTESELQRQSDMGVHAAQVLENPAFAEAFEAMRASIVTAWAAADVRDTEGQQLLLQQIKIVERLKGTLAGMIDRGKLANSKMPVDDLQRESPMRRAMRRVL